MTKLRRTAIVIASLLLALPGVLAAAPAAFAMRAIPPDDAGPNTPTYIVTQSGLSGWQVALVAIGAALAAALLTAIIVRVRFNARLQPVAG